MSKIIIQGKCVLISSETGFVYHSIGDNSCNLINLSTKPKSTNTEEEESVQCRQNSQDKSVEKDVTINFVCSALSSDDTLLAIQSPEKVLLVYEIQSWRVIYQRQLGRGASKIIFSPDNKNVVVGDKTGDVFLYDIFSNNKETSLLGHLSMVLDIIMTDDSKYIITCDRDEKIRVSHYPDCYNIESYCLGHEQFVTNVQFLPHNKSILISCSGDGTVRLWDYLKGDVKDVFKFKNDSVESNVESNNQLKCFTSVELDKRTSIVCVSVFKSNTIHVLMVKDGSFQKANTLNLSYEPAHLQLSWYEPKSSESTENGQDSKVINLWLLGQKELYLYTWSVIEETFVTASNSVLLGSIGVINNNLKELMVENNTENVIYVLQKRKMDEITDYYKRKQARIEEKNKKH